MWMTTKVRQELGCGFFHRTVMRRRFLAAGVESAAKSPPSSSNPPPFLLLTPDCAVKHDFCFDLPLSTLSHLRVAFSFIFGGGTEVKWSERRLRARLSQWQLWFRYRDDGRFEPRLPRQAVLFRAFPTNLNQSFVMIPLVESPSLRSLSTRHENIDEGKHTVNDAPIDPIQDAIHETLFTLQQPQGFYAFLIPAFILTMAVYSVALFPAFVCQTGYLKYTLGHFPDRSLATSLCMIGLDATGLALLLTCRTTVANLRRGSVQRETQRRDIQKGLLPRPDRGYRRQLQIMGGSDGLDHGPWLSKIAPCIDWSLLRAGSWGRAYLEIIIPWAGFVALHFGVFISLADTAPVISEVASAVMQFAIEVLLVWIALEQYREKSWPQKLKSAMIISVSLCTLSQVKSVPKPITPLNSLNR
ncbi:hypothetical protein DFJ73DRAFT_866208 [Zopfochytrium polystomum]|nr:hypothetical protein DFJ73DRAFT_866208 [Zopfochytrium polystomum]